MDDPPGLRRTADLDAITNLTQSVALLSQRVELTEKGEDARAIALQKSIEALGARVESVLTVVQTGSAEPDATPAGRTLLRALTNQDHRISQLETEAEANERFRNEISGAIKTLRASTIVLGVVATVISIVATLLALAPTLPAA